MSGGRQVGTHAEVCGESQTSSEVTVPRVLCGCRCEAPTIRAQARPSQRSAYLGGRTSQIASASVLTPITTSAFVGTFGIAEALSTEPVSQPYRQPSRPNGR